MEFLFEIVFEIYIELMLHIVPEEKATSKKYKTIICFIAIMVLLGVFALFIWGCVLIFDYDNKLGLIPIAVSIVILIVQIILGFILHNRKSEK